MAQLNIPQHPVIPAPTLEQLQVEATRQGVSAEQALAGLLKRIAEVVRAEETDAFRYGWEPGMWLVEYALLGVDESYIGQSHQDEIQRRFGWTWEQWAAAMREHLGFARPVKVLLVMGANRSGKSESSVKLAQKALCKHADQNVASFHMSNPRSVRDQQPLFWKYMPPEFREQKAGIDEYVKYKRKTGFSEGSFILPNKSECIFLNYMQDRDTALEGLELDWALPDELVPPDWVETLRYRIATRAGRIVITFTPVNGYTPTVKMFCDGATVAKESVAFALPTDGGEPDEARALGLSAAEYAEINEAATAGRPARAPQSRPEDVHAWLEGQPSQPPVPVGRAFERVPRVLRCVDRELAVVFFHSADNPYGNPKEVMAAARTKGREERRIRLYGVATKTVANRFPKFKREVHVIADDAIPTTGTNYMLMDPASDRNFFITWIRATPECTYIYREWPGSYDIPGVGVPGPWAVPSGRKEGLNDGARGEGQSNFGFGLLRYKFEIARLEGWADWRQWLAAAADKQRRRDYPYPTDEELERWDEANGADEVIEMRYVDSRAASTPRVERDRPVTLYETLVDTGMDFMLTPGAGIDDGVEKMNSALDYEVDEQQSFWNRPRLLVARSCVNTIYALENWMGVDGDKGACKDPIDNPRYYYTLDDTGFVEEATYAPRPGFHYGRGVQRHSVNQERPGGIPRPGARRIRVSR